MNSLGYLFLLLAAFICVCVQTTIAAKSSPEVIDPAAIYAAESSVVLNKVQNELVNALDLLQNYQEGASITPLKLAEKRRNKFEFIRFGRRRR